jgi:hypothetical protein
MQRRPKMKTIKLLLVATGMTALALSMGFAVPENGYNHQRTPELTVWAEQDGHYSPRVLVADVPVASSPRELQARFISNRRSRSHQNGHRRISIHRRSGHRRISIYRRGGHRRRSSYRRSVRYRRSYRQRSSRCRRSRRRRCRFCRRSHRRRSRRCRCSHHRRSRYYRC